MPKIRLQSNVASPVAGNIARAAANENNRRAFFMVETLRKSGKNYSEIAIELNRNGYRTSQGGQFQATQVMRLAKRASDLH